MILSSELFEALVGFCYLSVEVAATDTFQQLYALDLLQAGAVRDRVPDKFVYRLTVSGFKVLFEDPLRLAQALIKLGNVLQATLVIAMMCKDELPVFLTHDSVVVQNAAAARLELLK